MMNSVFLGLSSNLGDRLNNINQAISLIQENIGRIEKQSSVYETEPWGFKHESFFLNQVILVKSDLDSYAILSEINKIEKSMGRIRSSERYSARIIDIDILFYNDITLQTSNLIIPHPEIEKRRFVLMPMAEIAGDFVHPVYKKSIKELFLNCKDTCKIEKFNIMKE